MPTGGQAAETVVAVEIGAQGASAERDGDAANKPAAALMTTGVARARGRLDSATSTSVFSETDIEKLGARSVAEIFRAIPGMRSESAGGDSSANISVRGLPIALGGSKFLQIQENGLPTLEFGDIAYGTAEQFLRADLNLQGLQVIRGGSASTFASNSPGGIVNLIDKTGETAGGAIQASTGVDFNMKRIDFDYGSPIGEGLRFHVGGFYRQGEGPRQTGIDGFKGGQIKFNVTKDFAGGYIRFYGKLLDDKGTPSHYMPVKVTGSNSDPSYESLPAFDIKTDAVQSRYFGSFLKLDGNNQPVRNSFNDGVHAKAKSFGVSGKFEVDGWTINEAFRYADQSGHVVQPYYTPNTIPGLPALINSASSIMGMMQATSISYASGPNAGQTIANPASLNGNGLLAVMTLQDTDLNSLNNVTNDLRASKEWKLGAGDLTFTAGLYNSSQDIDTTWRYLTMVTDVKGGGEASLINISAGPVSLTENGVLGYSGVFIGGTRNDRYDLNYRVNAPYGSLNYTVGKVSLGASVRRDSGTAKGSLAGTTLPGRTRFSSFDVNGNGTISLPETKVSIIPYSQPAVVDYSYNYLSYSLSANYRMSQNYSMFARYSKGGRANADRILFANYVSPTSGRLLVKDAAYDPVQQAEGGFKYRSENIEIYTTGFWAKTSEHNINLDRSYRAYGLELEAAYRRGIFSVTGGATYTKAEITRDALNPATVGNSPKHQADLIFQVTPQIQTERFTVGANIQGTTDSFAGDNSGLKMPGYTVVNGFVQYRPKDRLLLSLNVNNMFNTLGLVEVNDTVVPANNITTARVIDPRTVAASVRVAF
ncbi:TonB-dependent receptor [Caulobacter sp. BP25]|nr:TonB-dependent receptor [Caulobacter sp. BP25]